MTVEVTPSFIGRILRLAATAVVVRLAIYFVVLVGVLFVGVVVVVVANVVIVAANVVVVVL